MLPVTTQIPSAEPTALQKEVEVAQASAGHQKVLAFGAVNQSDDCIEDTTLWQVLHVWLQAVLNLITTAVCC